MLITQRIGADFLLALFFFANLVVASNVQAESHPDKIQAPVSSGKFELLKEPSGLTSLDDDTFIVVEDESSRALRRLSLTESNPAEIQFEEFQQTAYQTFIEQQLLAPLKDLEGIARISPTQIVVMGSHQKASRGKEPHREKMVMFTMDGNEIVNSSYRKDLFDQLDMKYPALTQIMRQKRGDKGEDLHLNIEGLAFDRKRTHLYIGLRTPLEDKKTIVIRLENVVDYLTGKEPVFAEEPIFLDLEKGGIRSIAYDDRSDQLLIISKRETGGNKRTRLWSLSLAVGSEPVKYRSEDKNLFDKVEGLTPFSGGFLFVRDQGDKRYLEDWFVLERHQLGLDVAAQ